MDVKDKTTVVPPGADYPFTVKVIDHGHGKQRVSVLPDGEPPSYDFSITNLKLQECQWRDEEEPPEDVVKAVEYYGYHVTNIVKRSKTGLYENVGYLRDTVESIRESITDDNIISHAGINWAVESLDSLQKLEILREQLTDAEFEIVTFKAQESMRTVPSGNLQIPTTKGPTSASLKSLVTMVVAYAQKDGYLEQQLIPDETVASLTEEGESNE